MAIQPKFYETLYLVRPDISPDDLTVIQNKVTSTITSANGEISRDEKWAERDLAYPINDYTRGTYYIVEFKALPNVIAGIEKHLAFHNVDVLRFMTISIDEPSAANADAPAVGTEKPAARETAPSASAPPAAPPAGSTDTATQAKSTPETPPEPPAAPETPAAAESTPATEDTPPESPPAQDSSDTSGFTAAPPLSSDEDKKSGGDN